MLSHNVRVRAILANQSTHVIVQDLFTIGVQSPHVVLFVDDADPCFLVILNQLITQENRHSHRVIIMLRPCINKRRSAEKRRSTFNRHLHTGANHQDDFLIRNRAVSHQQDLIVDRECNSHPRKPVVHELVPALVPDVRIEVCLCQLQVVGGRALYRQVVSLTD